MAKIAKTSGGLGVDFKAAHRDGHGNLISNPIAIPGVEPPECARFSCIMRFVVDTVFLALLAFYHTRRVAYAEENRNKLKWQCSTCEWMWDEPHCHYCHHGLGSWEVWEKAKPILNRYRTGEDAPTSILGAIRAILKLTCPVCRKFNLFPRLGGDKKT